MGRISSHDFGSMDDKLWLLENLFKTQQTQAEKVPELKTTDLTKLAEAFQPVTYAADDVVILAGDEDESHARLVLFRTGGAEVNAALLDDDHADADGGKRKSIKKNKRITRLKSPFYVGEGWILTGNTPKASVKATGTAEAYALPKEEAKRLTSAGNTSIKLIQRDLKICAFERAHLHGFVNTLFQKNLDDDDLMAAFDGYGKEAFCTESFDFCREVHAFKRDVVGLDFPSSKSRLAKISEAYFQSGILNLSAKQRKALDKAKDDAEAQGDSKILVEGLENPLQQVYKEIQQSQITPFMKSKHDDDFLAKKFPIPVVRRTLLVRAAKGGGGGGKDDSGACVVS
ncbi:hypothetical protein JL721_3437 [Aureococcus anophagefferens]|nr:hypothetical protein JL721_3437 [Aureococcus anophagefferens]